MTILGLGKLTFPNAGSSIEAERKYFTDKFLLWFVVLAAIAVLMQFVMIGLSWKNLPPLVPVFYSKPWGTDILVKPIYLLILPGFSVFVLLLNLILSLTISAENRFLNRIFAFSSLFVCFAILFDIFKIITLIV